MAEGNRKEKTESAGAGSWRLYRNARDFLFQNDPILEIIFNRGKNIAYSDQVFFQLRALSFGAQYQYLWDKFRIKRTEFQPINLYLIKDSTRNI